MNSLTLVFAAVLSFKLGQAFDRWASGRMDVEEEFYLAGYDEGYTDGERERGWNLPVIRYKFRAYVGRSNDNDERD